MRGVYALPATEGDRVRFQTKTLNGEGIFTACWMGIEEVWDVRIDNGSTIHVFPCFGETMERKENA